MNRKFGIFVVLIGLFAISLVFGAETESASVDKDVSSASVDVNGTRAHLEVYFFYGRGCSHCANVEPFLAEMERKYPLQLHRYDIYSDRSSLSLFDEYSRMYGLSLERRGVPTVFVSDTYFVGDRSIIDGFEETVKTALKASFTVDRVLEEEAPQSLGEEGASMAGSLSIVTVTIAALIDAVSPCSIAILVFLIGARVLVADRRRRALKVGLAFCLSVFIAYFLFGLGLFTFVQLSGFSGIFSVLVGLIAVLAGILYLKDVFWYDRGGFAMEVPNSLKPFLMKLLKGVTSPFGAFAMGFVVCLFELPCTGGPYLFILGQLADSATRLQAIPLLLYYNFIFVLPLVVISLLLYSNLFSISKVREWNDRNKRLLRFLGGLAMISLGFFVIPVSPILQFVQMFLGIFRTAGPCLMVILFLYFIVHLSKRRDLANPLKGTLLLSMLVTLVFAPSPVNLSGGEAQSGGCVVTVRYQDGCPRSNAEVFTIDPEVIPIGITGEDGTVSCGSLDDGEYWIEAEWPPLSPFGYGAPIAIISGEGSATIEENSDYPNGTEPCGDSECDGFQYCIGDPKYIECDSWDTECNTKKCCQCDGGTQANPTENYDETQDEDCGAGYECSGLDTCSPISTSFHATVLYSDDCPVEGHLVIVRDIGSGEIVGACYPTDINGHCETFFDPPLLGNWWYLAEAWESSPGEGELCEPGSSCLGAQGNQTDENGNLEVTIPPQEATYYPNGTESCGDSECDGYKYCIVPEVGNPYIKCDSWDTECDTKKCCHCDGGTQANPAENYDETQCEDCDPYDLPEVAMCTWDPDGNPYTWDYHPAIDSVCQDLDTCTYESGYYDYTHTCSVDQCGAECDSNDDCASGFCRDNCTCSRCVIKVQYQDGCPRSGADVIYLWPEPGDFIGSTDENGMVSCDHLPYPEEYLVQAWYGGEQFGIEEGLPIDENGDGSATITNSSILDTDDDGVGDCHDSCWDVSNADQLDSNSNCPSSPYLTDPRCGDVCERDAAVTDIVPARTVDYQGNIINITITVKNEGAVEESFDVSVYYNNIDEWSQINETKTVNTLAPGQDVNVTFEWNTTDVTHCCNYMIKANATQVPSEIDTADNTRTYESVRIKMMGDVNDDGIVNIIDLAMIGRSYGTVPEDFLWNPEADINHDDLISIEDLATAARNYLGRC